jgi:enoyl-CoA hydratase/carnithine racemase
MTVNSGGARLVVEGHIGTIWLDRPTARNAMLHTTWCALPKLLAQAEADNNVGVIVMRGANSHFGAGNDIAEFGEMRTDPTACRAYGKAMADAMAAVELAVKPVVAVIQGNCYGASVALTLAADFRVAADNARLAITPAKLGALYLRSDLHRLITLIGQGQARRMIFTAATLEAPEAASIGLIDQLVDTESFDSEIHQIVQTLLNGSPYTLRHSKRMMHSLGHGPAPSETDESLGWFVDAMQGTDFAEGVAAFIQKRPPTF